MRSQTEVKKILDGLDCFLSDTPPTDLRNQVRLVLGEIYKYYSDHHCINCFKTGTIVEVDWVNGETTTTPCPCAQFYRKNECVKLSVENAGIPERYRDAEVGKWNDPAETEGEKVINKRTIDIVTAYAADLKRMKDRGYGLFLCGPNGVGKTYLACAIAIVAVRQDWVVKYYTMSKIVRCILDGWYDNEKKVIVNDIEEADFLIIDDIDKPYQTSTGMEIAIFDNLFRERLQNNRPMLLTSNKAIEQIEETRSESMRSMFSEHCAECVIVGSDFRKGIASSIKDSILGDD